MTSFLLKFLKRSSPAKRKDIFVDSLEVLGYIHKNDEGKYRISSGLGQGKTDVYQTINKARKTS